MRARSIARARPVPLDLLGATLNRKDETDFHPPAPARTRPREVREPLPIRSRCPGGAGIPSFRMMATGRGPWFEGERLEAFGVYWAVLEANYAEIVADTLREAVAFAPSLSRQDNAQSAREDGTEVLRLVWRAVRAGDWTAYEAKMEARGAAFARLGVSIEDWSDIVLLTSRCSIRFVAEAHGRDPARLAVILAAMSDFWGRSIRIARGQYARTRDDLAAMQGDALRRSEARFARLSEAGIVGIIITEMGGSRILEANDAFLGMLGYRRADLAAGLRWDTITPRESMGVSEQAIGDLRRAGAAQVREKEYLHKDGHRVPTLFGAARLEAEQAITFVLDQSDRRRLEEQLRQSQKLEAVGRLAGGVAHDFNNLLSVIIGYCDLIAPGLTGGRAAEDLQEIRRAGESAASLTEQLLAFSRKQVLSPRVINLSATIAEMDRMMRRLIGEHIELVTLPEQELGNVRVDPHQVEQVVMNLVVNARDAMPRGGKLVVETTDVELDPAHAETLGVAPGPYVRLAVSDSGEGMGPEVLSRIFDPFFSTKGERGTGLGLATVFGIVRQSGGAISVYSEPGRGTTFKVYFPRTGEDVEPAVAAPETATLQGTETVLLVDDSEQVRALVHEILRRQGYQVIVASSPGEALLAAEQHPGEISLLLTDVIMPKMTGRQLAERLARMRPALKVLYMSGYTENTVVHGGTLDPGIAFLPKPITPAALLRKVRETIGPASSP